MSRASLPRCSRPWLRTLALLALLLAVVGQAPGLVAAAPPPAKNLEFSGGDGGIVDSGFTAVLANTNSAKIANLTLAGGSLQIAATAGDLPPFGAGQDNALAIQYDSSGSYTIGARLLNPSFSGPSQSAGIYIAQSGGRYLRFTAGYGSKGSNGERLQLDVVEKNGKLRSTTIALAPGTLASITTSLDLFLNVDHAGGGKLTALYRIDSDDASFGRLATTRALPRWMRGGVVPVFAGVITTNRGAAVPLTVDFDWFRLTNAPQVTPSVTGTKTVDRDGISPGATVMPGDELTYTVSVTNHGTSATGVHVADPLPVDTTFVAGSTTNGATYDAATNEVRWQNLSVAAGATASFTFKAKINAAPLQSSTIVNTAALTSDAGGFPALLSASTVVGATPDLTDSTFNASPALVGPNGTVTYTLDLLNGGTAPVEGANALLIVPTGTALVAGSAQASSGSLTIDPSLSSIAWSAAAPLLIDGTATISFAVKPGSGLANGSALVSQAILQGDAMLPTVLTAQSTYSVASAIAGTKTVDRAVADPGATLAYTFSVANTSGVAVSNIQVIDPMPQDTTYQAGVTTSPGAPAPAYQAATNRVVWTIPSLAASETMTMSFKVRINALPLHSALVTNKATLAATSIPQTLLSASTVVRGVADLTNSLYTATPATVGPLGTIAYTLNLRSDGTTAATNASADLTIPDGTTLVAGSATASSGALSLNTTLNKLTWTAGAPLPAGTVVRITFKAKLSSTIVKSTYMSTATLRAAGTVPNVKTALATFNQFSPDRKYYFLPLINK
jgi:uncharacterized repeat protein (TIGR01451 family)